MEAGPRGEWALGLLATYSRDQSPSLPRGDSPYPPTRQTGTTEGEGMGWALSAQKAWWSDRTLTYQDGLTGTNSLRQLELWQEGSCLVAASEASGRVRASLAGSELNRPCRPHPTSRGTGLSRRPTEAPRAGGGGEALLPKAETS